MNRLKFPLFISILFVFIACEDDFGSKTVTYTRATAVYGDLEALRATPLIGHAQEIEDPGKIFVYDDLILVGEEGVGIHVIDNSQPSAPVNVSFLAIPGNREFFIDEGYLYAESMYDMLKVDISNIQQPVVTSRINNAFLATITNSSGEAIIGFDYEQVTEQLDLDDLIFDYEAENSIYYYDINNSLIPPSAVPASFAGNSGSGVGSVNRIIAYDGYVYAVSREKMNVFDSRSDFTQVFSQSVGWNMETVYPLGDRLFVGGSNAVDIFDITNRESPQLQSSYFHTTSCDPILPVEEETAYLTIRTGDFAECPGDDNQLLVLDISDPNFVSEIQRVDMESPFGMNLVGDKLYVGEGSNGMKVFDATDRRNLKLLRADHSVEAYDVLAHPNRADVLLIAGPGGLTQYQLSGNFELHLVSNIAF